MDSVFKALADPTRRGLLDELFREDGQSLSALEVQLPMTRFGVMKHLRVLERAGLVVARKQGREKLHYLNSVPIRLIHDRWVSKYAEPWASGLSELKTDLEGSTMETIKTVSWADGSAPVAAGTAVFEVFIKTTPERLWEAITDPEQRKLYSFGVETRSDWTPSSEYTSSVPGVVEIAAGRNVEVDPPRLLVQTFDALWSEDVKAQGDDQGEVGDRARGQLLPAHSDPRPATAGRERGAIRRLADDPLRAQDADRDGRAARHAGIAAVRPGRRGGLTRGRQAGDRRAGVGGCDGSYDPRFMPGVRSSLIAVAAVAAAAATAPATGLAAATGTVGPEGAAAAAECPASECAVAHPAAGGAAPGQVQPKGPGSSAKLLGQRIMVGLQGTAPDAGLLARVRAGEVGSVILFAANIVSSSQVRALTGALQRAARQGGNPPLLIATDQEGGQVKRFPNGPPYLSPPQMASEGTIKGTYREGQLTGGYLRSHGVNWDLAPVSDVPTRQDAFIWQQGRAFSFSPSTVASYADAFARGLESMKVAATAKHFPGVGSAAVDTDNKLDELRPTGAQLAGALRPYEKMIPRGLDSVMLSTAGFPAYDPSGAPAALSSPIARGLLRQRLGFRGVTITDALGTPTGHDEITAGRIAARAGADVLLYTDSADGELSALESDLSSGRLGRAAAVASYERIVALKRRIT